MPKMKHEIRHSFKAVYVWRALLVRRASVVFDIFLYLALGLSLRSLPWVHVLSAQLWRLWWHSFSHAYTNIFFPCCNHNTLNRHSQLSISTGEEINTRRASHSVLLRSSSFLRKKKIPSRCVPELEYSSLSCLAVQRVRHRWKKTETEKEEKNGEDQWGYWGRCQRQTMIHYLSWGACPPGLLGGWGGM